ncbi:MAG: hypothetical protein IKK21_04335 [Clostridia bacterium]|nr:hypothetical protein [Clostridia bacterium]
MKLKLLLRLAALLLAAVIVMTIPPLLAGGRPDAALPGAEDTPRTLLRIWVTDAPGGGMAWLRKQLSAFEKTHPGVSAYVRQVSPEMLQHGDHPLPEIILFMPGDVTDPDAIFLPMTGAVQGEEALLRAGRWQGRQYAAPLCWSGWVLAVDSRCDDVPQTTPAPTTLLGRPAATPAPQPSATPGYPAEKVKTAAVPLLAPHTGGLFSLRALLGSTEIMPSQEHLTTRQVYDAFLQQKTASALLTTGHVAALESLQRAGRSFPCRILTPEEIITDQVWMAGLTGSSSTAAALIAYLTGEDAQRGLTEQSLHGIDLSHPMYFDGVPALMEAAARRSLTVINAFHARETVSRAAWQAFLGDTDALPPLL